ncbi:MAG: hypothetical protein V1886_02585 [archaeon]
MDKEAKIGKVVFTVLAIIGFFAILSIANTKINPESIKIKYIIPLTGNSVAEVSIDENLIKEITRRFNQIITQNEIPEDNLFLIDLSVNFQAEKRENLSIGIETSSLLQEIELRDKNDVKLDKISDNLFKFQKDLFPGDISIIRLVGRTGILGEEPFTGVNLKIKIYSNDSLVYESSKTIKICKKGVVGGCSNLLKEVSNEIQGIINENFNKTDISSPPTN